MASDAILPTLLENLFSHYYLSSKQLLQTASEEYAKAMSICQQLSETCPDGGKGDDDAKQLERQDLFLTRADTVLRPLFRYCQYELKQAGHELTVEEPRLATSTTSSVTKDDETSITFRGHDLLLDSKELRVLLLKLQSLKDDEVEDEKKETQKDETSFLTALSVIDDALEVVQTSLSILKQAQEGPAVQAKRQNLNLWKGYLKNEKTQRVMDHTTKLLVQNMGHAERVHVYESLLQMATSLLELPRPSSDEDDEEDEFALQVQANILRLRALKTYHMAWYYYQQARKYSKALTLVQHSQKLSKRAQEEIAACDEDMPHADQYLQELEDLPIASAQAAIQAALHLKQGGVSSSTNGHSTKRPLLLRLDDEDAGMVLADEDLMPMPIPCKPVFYDLAYDIATDASPYLDTLQSYVDKHTAPSELEPEEKTGGRLLGWLGGSK